MKGRKPKTKWIRVGEGENEYYICSNCEMKWFLAMGNPIENEMFYCPKCGAKMDKNIYVFADDVEDPSA